MAEALKAGRGHAAATAMPSREARPYPSASLFAACGVLALAAGAGLLAETADPLPFGLQHLSGPTLAISLSAPLICLIWPELALPVIIIGAELLDREFGGGRVRHLVFMKLALLIFAAVGVLLKTWGQGGRMPRVKTPADFPAVLLAGYTALSAAYAYLVVGRDLDLVAVAGYHLSQLALYHFLVTTTLGREQAFRRAGLIVAGRALLMVVPSILGGGRHGGTGTTWLIVLLCYALLQRTNWGVLAWVALPLAMLDTVTCGFRTLWVTVGGQLAWLALAGIWLRLHRLAAVAVFVLVAGVGGVFLALGHPGLLAGVPSAVTLDRYQGGMLLGGYRVPEAVIGIESALEHPLLGQGMGYQTQLRWVQTMGNMAVGPIHHIYYVSYLSNEGLVGLALVLWYFGAVLFSRPARQLRRLAAVEPWAAVALGLQAAFFGAILGAFLSGPPDGHWTWGMFGAASLLPATWIASRPAGGGTRREWARPPYRRAV